MIGHTHRRLRRATRAQHERLEARVDIFRRIRTRAGRRRLVQDFHDLHVAAEAGLASWLADLPGLDFDARRRAPRIAQDLAVLGGAPRAAEPILVASVSEALGVLYVLEGSTLGGHVIRRRIEAEGGDMAGLSFLDPYGASVGERWRAFLAVLDAAPDPDEVVAGAVAGFGHAERRLCEAEAV